MQITKTIKLQEYEANLKLVLTDDVKRVINRLYKKHKITEKYQDNLAGCMFTLSMDTYYLILSDHKLTYNTINHEIFHLTMALTGDRGVYEEEQRALVQGYVSQFIFDFLKEKKVSIG